MEKFYITTTLPYVNSNPHLGFALEMVQADVIARYHGEALKQDVFFNTGTDEHGLKVYRKALEQGKDTQKYVDEYADKFKQLMPALGISPNVHFIRTTDRHHVQAAREFWKRCFDNGDIYKKIYKVKYCVGCELEKAESDLDQNGRCLIHPNLEIEFIEEENYFFKFSRYQQKLLDFYQARPGFVVPDFRFNEIKQFVKNGLQDFSISRLADKMPWGVPVPDDEAHVMYVWFDALINYISTLGWPEDEKKFEEFWGTIENPKGLQIAGKDNLRQQSAMWQAMLMSAGLSTSRQIIIHGFINSGGQKMSKSLGNIADPYQILEQLQAKGLTKEQAVDALRYYLLREIPTFEDGDYTWEKFLESYNANLANGIGNLTSRILKMAKNLNMDWNNKYLKETYLTEAYHRDMGNYELQKATDEIWNLVSKLDSYIQVNEPFKVAKVDPQKAKDQVGYLVSELLKIGHLLLPVLPSTSKNILKFYTSDDIPRLFPRIDS